MNVVDPEHGVLGCYGIVGGSIATATGAALSLRGAGSIAVAYFGDGTVNQAYFFECLNFAKVIELPVVFVCENNGYGEYTPFEAVTPGGIVPRAAAIELRDDGGRRDGRRRDRDRGREVVDRVRRVAGPSSSRRAPTASSATRAATPASYRPEGELDAGASATRSPSARCRAGSVPTRPRSRSRRRSRRSWTRIEASALVAPFPGGLPIPSSAR